MAPLAHDAAAEAICRVGRSLHQRGYAAVPDAHCVLQTHSTHRVQLSLQGVWDADDVVPPITPYCVMKVGHVPLVAYTRPGDPQAADEVLRRIEAFAARGTPIRAVLFERLGPLVWNASAKKAGATLEELEETARLWLGCGRQVEPLDAAAIDALRQAFGARW